MELLVWTPSRHVRLRAARRTRCGALVDQWPLAVNRRALQAASVALDNREGRVADVSDRIEQGLMLVGATAVEDKLQVRGAVGPGSRC